MPSRPAATAADAAGAADSAGAAAGASLADVRNGLERFSAAFGRFERIPAGGKSVVLLLVLVEMVEDEVRQPQDLLARQLHRMMPFSLAIFFLSILNMSV